MTKSFFSRFLISASLLCVSLVGFADSFVVVEKPAKIFDEPNVKGYVTLNTRNQEVAPSPGMVFKSLENSNGWHLVEYSPGLRGYISDQRLVKPTRIPKAGSYKVTNKPGANLNVSSSGDKWMAEIDGIKYQGIVSDNVIIFMNSENQPAYSLAVVGEDVIAMCYDNNCTGFF